MLGINFSVALYTRLSFLLSTRLDKRSRVSLFEHTDFLCQARSQGRLRNFTGTGTKFQPVVLCSVVVRSWTSSSKSQSKSDPVGFPDESRVDFVSNCKRRFRALGCATPRRRVPVWLDEFRRGNRTIIAFSHCSSDVKHNIGQVAKETRPK